jgi:hypothetical protein
VSSSGGGLPGRPDSKELGRPLNFCPPFPARHSVNLKQEKAFNRKERKQLPQRSQRKSLAVVCLSVLCGFSLRPLRLKAFARECEAQKSSALSAEL